MRSKQTQILISEKTASELIVFNFVMGFFHLIQGLLILFLSNSFSVPITTHYLGKGSEGIITTISETIANLRIGPLIAVFLFLSAIAHFLTSAPKIRTWYVQNLKRKINYIRWYEYAFSSSLMIVIIALLCGMNDLPSLILIFTLNGIMNLFGLLMELHNQTTNKTNWISFIFGCIAGIIPWIVIAMYFFGAALNTNGSIPAFVYFILLSLFVTFNIFALNMFLQFKGIGKWRNYIFGEKVYIVLSLVAKSALAWQVFSGTLRG